MPFYILCDLVRNVYRDFNTASAFAFFVTGLSLQPPAPPLCLLLAEKNYFDSNLPSSGHVAEHPCHCKGRMEVCGWWRLRYLKWMYLFSSINEPLEDVPKSPTPRIKMAEKPISMCICYDWQLQNSAPFCPSYISNLPSPLEFPA